MWSELFFTLLFIFGVYYLLRNSYNIAIAAERSKEALYPGTEEEYKNIFPASENKEMEPLTKDTRTYRFVQWGTAVAIVLLGILFVYVITTDLHFSFLTAANLFGFIIFLVRLPGNFYIHSDGLILNGKFFSPRKIKGYSVEKIVRWHELYGLHPGMNNGYKLTLHFRKGFVFHHFVVIRELEELKKVEKYLHDLGIYELNKEQNEDPGVKTPMIDKQ